MSILVMLLGTAAIAQPIPPDPQQGSTAPPQQTAPQPAIGGPLEPGEAFVTRFSGVLAGAGNLLPTLDANGTVGSIVDMRAPGKPPQGAHWMDEPQRNPVTAREVGQVFGVAFDDATPPNIYLTASSAFGLHRAPGNGGWMDGMWGPGGPGAIYKLEAASGYRPRIFATVALNGRANSGPALGNIAYDRWNRQFFVSDLETGMIHRIGLDGADRGTFDHGTQGRPRFVDGQTGQPASLEAIPFDTGLQAAVTDCPTQPFDRAPECWNYADSGRRVWGLGVTRQDPSQEVRLYYAVWSGPAFAQENWNQRPEDDKRNAIWSVRLGPDGGADPSSVRREFALPDFFTKPEDIARAGYSSPVSDISFPACSTNPVMLVAERGGIRNLGLESDNAFATPHESRLLRYERDQAGLWRPIGRYDVGFYERTAEGDPRMRANCAGGAAFGPGYAEQTGQAEPGQTDQYVWMTGDSLCSPTGPCTLPADPAQAGNQPSVQPAAEQGAEQDDSEVHGIQGMRENLYAGLLEGSGAIAGAGQQSRIAGAAGPSRSYLIDADVNVDGTGQPIPEELTRNDATKIGDIAIYQTCPTPPSQWTMLTAMPAPVMPMRPPGWVAGAGGATEIVAFGDFHRGDASHAMTASHGTPQSHFRLGSHALQMSHGRWGSHDLSLSHGRYGTHNVVMSQRHLVGSSWGHNPALSSGHFTGVSWGHNFVVSRGHRPWISQGHQQRVSRGHNPWISRGHEPIASRGHNPWMSRGHNPGISRGHNPQISQNHAPVISRGHNRQLSQGHAPAVSRGHNPQLSQGGTHDRMRSGGGTHNAILSQGGTHDRMRSQGGTHNAVLSRGSTHRPDGSQGGTHSVDRSRGTHNAVQSGGVGGAHLPVTSRDGGTHSQVLSRGGTHNAVLSRGGTHNAILSRGSSHRTEASRGTQQQQQHNIRVSRGSQGHTVLVSRGVNRHTVLASRGVNRHSAIASRGVNRHSAIASRGVNRHSVVASRGINRHSASVSRGINRHNAIASRGINRHSAMASRGMNRHSPTISRGVLRGRPDRFGQPPSLTRRPMMRPYMMQPRVMQPRMAPRQFAPRSFQPRSFQPGGFQPRSFQPRGYRAPPQMRQPPRGGRPQGGPRGYNPRGF